jgi:L-ascorbate metabolism protein UlaG (beta-lactamase superfamily)
MKVTYIYHSSFCVELDHSVLLFDYFKGELPKFDPEKEIYVFSSHKHYDHFDKKIFNLALEYQNIQFILSNDIKMNEKYLERSEVPKVAWDKICYVKNNEVYQLKHKSAELTLETLKSTDAGVAFILTTNGTTIYHAGDLNWWTWIGETEAEYDEMTKAFQDEMEKIERREFDVAFLPLDPRQEERFYYGLDYFMRHTQTKRAYPMHFWEKPEVIDQLIAMEVSEPYRGQIKKLGHEGDYDEF